MYYQCLASKCQYYTGFVNVFMVVEHIVALHGFQNIDISNGILTFLCPECQQTQ